MSSRGHNEAGAVLVIFALWLPVLAAAASFAIDASNWFVHKRHLQMEADAAALAGGGLLRIGCTDPTLLQQEVQKYAGISGSTYNFQIGKPGPSGVHLQPLNSSTFYSQSSPVDTTVPADPNACMSKTVDVKLTDTNVPWFFRAAHVPFINAHARVSVLQVDTLKHSLPVSVGDVRPKHVAATFVDESNNGASIAGPVSLTENPNAPGQWANPVPLPVTMSHQNIGVRIAVGYGKADPPICGTALVDCFDQVNGSNGILYIRGWSSTPAGTGTAPQPRSVELIPQAGCTTAYFSNGACAFRISAHIDFGTGAVPNTTHVIGTSQQISGSGTGQLKNDILFPNAPIGDLWTSEQVTAPAATGPMPISLQWYSTANGATCTLKNPCPVGPNAPVQRAFTAVTANSGPIQSAIVSESGSSKLYGDNSFQSCATSACRHNTIVTVSLTPSLKVASAVGDPIVHLRTTGAGSQTQAVDCDPAPGTNLNEEMQNGCAPEYTRNTGTACPSTYPALQDTAQPWNCVALQTGTVTNSVVNGLAQRILGGNGNVCTTGHESHWSSFPNLPDGDTRIVSLFIVPPGSNIGGSGNAVVPVIDFATFYVTGWQGSTNNDDPCSGDDRTGLLNGEIVGHFITYIDTLGNGEGSGPCDASGITPCTLKLTI
jgi:Putative Flp pilus-assembly TadE/G-like